MLKLAVNYQASNSPLQTVQQEFGGQIWGGSGIFGGWFLDERGLSLCHGGVLIRALSAGTTSDPQGTATLDQKHGLYTRNYLDLVIESLLFNHDEDHVTTAYFYTKFPKNECITTVTAQMNMKPNIKL
ncbi:unnamed protein product [Pieris brassicae]|uniref:Uncharacterized protein n=1 Tax=Pieris brassicae TaxID=7116 RepID=A0A9P0XGE7_PIEBR|nr:unnamed protein product [Pieris brassicae]